MVSLNLERINSNSPYAVTALRDSMCFRFVTDFGVIYYVSFLEDELFFLPSLLVIIDGIEKFNAKMENNGDSL